MSHARRTARSGGRRRGLAAVAFLAASTASLAVAAPAHAATTTDVRVSRTASGAQPDSDARIPSVSRTGRYVAYVSAASDILGPAVYDQVYLFDRQTSRTVRVTTAPDGSPGNGPVQGAAVSADGRYVVFASQATNLVDLTLPARQIDSEVYRYDVRTGAVQVISTLDGQPLPHLTHLLGLAVSATGRYVAFTTNHRVLPQDTNNFEDVYRLDASAGTVALVSRSYDGGPTDQHSFSFAVSSNGDRVVFSSQAGNIVQGATNPRKTSELYAARLSTGTTRLVTPSVDGGIADDVSYAAYLTPDGRRVVFLSRADDLVTGEVTTDPESVFVADLQSRTVQQVDVSAPNLDFASPMLSDDGQWLVYQTNDGNGATQILRRSLVTGSTLVVAANGEAVHDVIEPRISGDGTSVAYEKITSKLTGPNSLPTEEVREWRVVGS